MLSATVSDALAAALDRVLEEMFFVCPFGEVPMEPEAEGVLAARLDFRGAPCGSMLVQVTPGAARSIAADFLARDADAVTTREVEDVVCELANIICGAALSRLESETAFSLRSPWVVAGDELPHFPNPAHCSVDIGTGTVKVLLQFHAEPCSTTEKSAS